MSTARDRGWGAGFPVNRAKDMVTVEHDGVKVSVNREIAPIVKHLMGETVRRGYKLKAGQCWGYANRPVRGGTAPSNHSWGLAVDINAPSNPMGDHLVTDMPEWMPKLWKEWGFDWGGAYKGRKDAMHYEFTGTPDTAKALRRTLNGQPKATPGPVPAPTVTTTSEVEGVKLTTTLVNNLPLDENGHGWFDVPCRLDELVSVTGHGSSPPDDGYWPPLTLNFQPRGDTTRVTIYGKPGQQCGFWWKRLAE